MIKLSDFVRMIYAPSFWYGQVKVRTIEQYLNSVCQYIEAVGDITVDQLQPGNHVRFFIHQKVKNVSSETIRKHCRHLNTIFSKLGPPGPKNRDALRFLADAPWIRPPQSFQRLPREVPDTVADRLYDAVSQCPECYEFPKYLDPELRPNWWKALILLVSTTAIRRGVAFGLSWADVDPAKKYFVVSHKLDKCKTERRKPLHPEVYRLLESVRIGDKILPWTHGNKKFYKVWHKLNETAGIMPHLKLHDLKRYALQLACRSGVDAATLQALGDHSNFRTTVNHYVCSNLEKYIETVRLPGNGGEQ